MAAWDTCKQHIPCRKSFHVVLHRRKKQCARRDTTLTSRRSTPSSLIGSGQIAELSPYGESANFGKNILE